MAWKVMICFLYRSVIKFVVAIYRAVLIVKAMLKQPFIHFMAIKESGGLTMVDAGKSGEDKALTFVDLIDALHYAFTLLYRNWPVGGAM